VARIGHDDQTMVAASLKDLLNMDFGSPLHSLVIPGQLQILEQDAVNFLKLKK
jgi:diphthamide biosynthesis methyltransferase